MADTVNNYTIRLNMCKERTSQLVNDLLGEIICRAWAGEGTRADITLNGTVGSYVKVDGEDYINLDKSVECAEKLINVLGRLPDTAQAEPDEDEEEDED